MIKYNEIEKTFLLSTNNTSYLMNVNENGYLLNLYYGKKLSDDFKLSGLLNHYHNLDLAYGMVNDYMPFEYGFFGRGDYHNPSFIIRQENGKRYSELKYLGYEINSPDDFGLLPHMRKISEKLSIYLIDIISKIKIELNYYVYEECDCICKNVRFINETNNNVYLEKAFSFCLNFDNYDYECLTLTGKWGSERHLQRSKLNKGIFNISSPRGNSSHQFNPFMGLRKDNEYYGALLIYSGSHKMEVECNSYFTSRLSGGVNDLSFDYELKALDKFITPIAIMNYSSEGFNKFSQNYHHFIRSYISNPKYVNSPRPILLNNWEATYFNFDNEKLMGLVDEASKLGIDTLVLDDGWFGHRNDDTSSLGDWFVNEGKLVGGLKTIINYAKSKGMKFGLWFEPEMISEDSLLFKNHPNYLIGALEDEPKKMRNQWILDFSNKDVVNTIYEEMCNILDNNDISYIKWDMNRNMSEFYSTHLSNRNQGELEYRYILGVYDLLNRITTRYPNLFLEGCAGGGGRFDPGMLYFFNQIWTSDNSDAYDRTRIQYGTSICYPLNTISTHVSISPNEQSGRMTPMDTRINIAFLGTYGFELDLKKTSEEDKEKVKESIINYKKDYKLIYSGNLFRLSEFEDVRYFIMMVVSSDQKEAILIGEKYLSEADFLGKKYKLEGLNPNYNYYIRELNEVYSGETLIKFGLFMPKGKMDFYSFVWHLEVVNEE